MVPAASTGIVLLTRYLLPYTDSGIEASPDGRIFRHRPRATRLGMYHFLEQAGGGSQGPRMGRAWVLIGAPKEKDPKFWFQGQGQGGILVFMSSLDKAVALGSVRLPYYSAEYQETTAHGQSNKTM